LIEVNYNYHIIAKLLSGESSFAIFCFLEKAIFPKVAFSKKQKIDLVTVTS